MNSTNLKWTLTTFSSKEIIKPKQFQFKVSNRVRSKVGCVFPMVVVSLLPHAEFRRNDHRQVVPRFTSWDFEKKKKDSKISELSLKSFP